MSRDLFNPIPYAHRPIDPKKAGDGWEYDRADHFYSGKSIRDITIDGYKDYPGDWASSIYLLTADAFQHFLPAFMRIATEVRSMPNAETEYAAMLGGNLVSVLSHIAQGEMMERKTALFDAYSAAQLDAVASFFEDEVRWDGSWDFPNVAAARYFWQQFRQH